MLIYPKVIDINHMLLKRNEIPFQWNFNISVVYVIKIVFFTMVVPLHLSYIG